MHIIICIPHIHYIRICIQVFIPAKEDQKICRLQQIQAQQFDTVKKYSKKKRNRIKIVTQAKHTCQRTLSLEHIDKELHHCTSLSLSNRELQLGAIVWRRPNTELKHAISEIHECAISNESQLIMHGMECRVQPKKYENWKFKNFGMYRYKIT